MRYRTMFLTLLLTLTTILISQQNISNAVMNSCDPMNESCNYQIKRVWSVTVIVKECTEGHDLSYDISFTRANMAWCSVHGTEPGPFQYFFMTAPPGPVPHSDDETTVSQ